jgi:hypothetical protein
VVFNGSTNTAQQGRQRAKVAKGLAATKGWGLADTPKWTGAVGGL